MAKKRFNPDRVAYFETAGWRAYYARKRFKLLRLMVQLGREQFHMPRFRAWRAAISVARAAREWQKPDHDISKVEKGYERFYRFARRPSGLNYDTKRVAALELRYNDDHRRLIDVEDKTPLLQTLTELHAALFGLAEAEARESAEHRVAALNAVDLITQKKSANVEADWRRVESELQLCYRSIDNLLQAKVA